MEIIINIINNYKSFLPTWLGILVAGFLGSWHCALMCGPMSCYVGQKKQWSSYQIGRLISYCGLGIFAGMFANKIISISAQFKFFTIGFMISILLFSYFKVKAKDEFFNFLNKKLYHLINIKCFDKKILSPIKESGFALGISSALLPCGWLWSFFIAAAITRSPMAGMIVMLLFWLSTLPALSLASMTLLKLNSKASVKQQKISKVVLLFASIYGLIMFWII